MRNKIVERTGLPHATRVPPAALEPFKSYASGTLEAVNKKMRERERETVRLCQPKQHCESMFEGWVSRC